MHTAFLCSVSSLLSKQLFVSHSSYSTESSISNIALPVDSNESSSSSFGSCRICGKLSFVDREEQKDHYKSQLHITNLKRSLMGLSAVSDLGDDDGADEMELRESSDSEEESDFLDECDTDVGAASWGLVGSELEAPAGIEHCCTAFPEGMAVKNLNNVTGATYRFVPASFPNTQVAVPAALLAAAARELDTVSGTNSPWEQLSAICTWNQQKPLVAVLLLQSGRFAGALFDVRTCLSSAGKQAKLLPTLTETYFREGSSSSVAIPQQHPSCNYYSGANLTCMKHKAIRRYTVRAKAGGSQSSHDGQGRKAKSMGAQLRRYGEQKLKDDVYEVLREWGSDGLMDRCSYILVSVGRTLQHVLFRDSGAAAVEEFPHKLSKTDPRVVRGLGMMVDKPTLEECCRVFRVCTAITFEKVPVKASASPVTEGTNVQVAPAEVLIVQLKHCLIATSVPVGVSVAVAIEASDDAFALSPDESSAVEAEELSDEQPLLARLLLKACRVDDVDTMRMVINGLKLAHNRRHWGSGTSNPANPTGPPSVREERPEDDNVVDETVFELDDEEESAEAGAQTEVQAWAQPERGNTTADGSLNSEVSGLLSEVRVCLGAQTGDGEFTMQDLLNLYISQLNLLDAEDGNVRHSLYYNTLNAPENYTDFRTPLHIACQRGCVKAVKLLLLSGVADPMKLDASGQAPYQHCERKDCKLVFRRVRALYESENVESARQHGRCIWNWDNCGGVPPGLSADAERVQKQKLKDKKKRAKAGKKERVQLEKEQQEANAAQEQAQTAVQEAKRREDTHRAGHCCVCDISLLNNKLVVNVFDQKCCSARCVMALRRRLAADAAEKRLVK